MTPTVRFEGGTILVEGVEGDILPPEFIFDHRVGMFRGPAIGYHHLVLALHKQGIGIVDEARAYSALDRPHRHSRTPRPYQEEAVEAWWSSGRRGIVVLPTGAGKSFVAELTIAKANRSTLVIAPTIDLVGQWHDNLKAAFGGEIGVLGGGIHEVHDITVSTYDSAHIHMGRYGDRFGLIIFDEVHHLPGNVYQSAALNCIAPFRLGLTATLERPDGTHDRIFDLVGPENYRREITDLSGDYLADYQTETVLVHLDQDEREVWDASREEYKLFVRSRGLSLSGRGGWARFLRAAAASSEGRSAHQAWMRAKRILNQTESKLTVLESLLRRYQGRPTIIFTNDNATVYRISRRFLLPAITHHTDIKERSQILADFQAGKLGVVVTSRVLNEGIDLPLAEVAIVLSGTSTVREHVQRLGRILRPAEGKTALLVELVVANTNEEFASKRRRDHVAYLK